MNDLDQRNGRYFALYYRIWQLRGPVKSKWLKVKPYCLRQNVNQRIQSLAIMTYGDILGGFCERIR